MCASSRRVLTSTVKLVTAAGVFAAVFAFVGAGWTQEAPNKDELFKVTSTVSGFGSQLIKSFDISYVDAKLGQYFLADRTNSAVDVTDTSSNALVQQLGKGAFVGFTGNNDTSGPDGVFTVDHRYVWAGDGNSTFQVFDLQSATPDVAIQTISTGGAYRVDEGCYDSRDHIVLWANDAEHDNALNWPFITFYASDTYTQLGKITLDGTSAPKATNGIEQCQWSADTGRFYLNVPEVNGPGDDSVAGAVLVINPTTRKIEHTWIISHDVCAGPQGMAIGPSNQILLGCNAPSGNGKFSTVIINQNSGAITRVLDNQSGADEVWYNPGDGHYTLGRSAARDATGKIDSQVGIVDSAGKRADQSFVTANAGVGAHSVAQDPDKNQIYVPIPANAGQGVCSAGGGTDANGCIAVLTATPDDHSRVAVERGPDDNQQ
jgi:hypothetical protein